jgi:polysaccharide deacetylase 2 family uncharacterized protein YibQ
MLVARSFAGGLVWGAVVVVGGLATISQLMPMPQQADGSGSGARPSAEVASSAAVVVPEGGAAVAPAVAQPAQEPGEAGTGQSAPGTANPAPAAPAQGTSATDTAMAPDTGPPAVEITAGAGGSSAPMSQEPVGADAVHSGPAAASADGATSAPAALASPPEMAAGAPQGGDGGALPVLPQIPATSEPAPALSSLDAALSAPVADPMPKGIAAPEPDPVAPKDALLVPSQGAGLAEPQRLPQIAAGGEALPGLAPLPEVAVPAPGDGAPAAPAPLAPRVIQPDATQMPGAKALTSTLPTVLAPSVPGVATNTLPHVGDAPKTGDAPAALPEDKPFAKFARSFDAPVGKPLFAILLQDVGSAGMNRADLAHLPFAVTFVVDPLASDAKEAAAAYRAAGQEVLMLANGIPPGATAGDVAQTFQTLQDTLPEAVGVIDEPTLGFQDNRALAGLVLPVIADQGRGLVTFDRGLNAADQIARRDGMPAAVVFRRLDGAGESQPTIRRYLDRAAFKAAQEGSVVVMGDTKADTVAAILQWALEGKGATMALAPVTAVMVRR